MARTGSVATPVAWIRSAGSGASVAETAPLEFQVAFTFLVALQSAGAAAGQASFWTRSNPVRGFCGGILGPAMTKVRSRVPESTSSDRKARWALDNDSMPTSGDLNHTVDH